MTYKKLKNLKNKFFQFLWTIQQFSKDLNQNIQCPHPNLLLVVQSLLVPQLRKGFVQKFSKSSILVILLNLTYFGNFQLCNSLYIPIVYQIGNHVDEGASIKMNMKNKKFALTPIIVIDTLLFFFHFKWCISSSHILSNLCYIEDCPPNILANSFIVPSNLLF